jgi:AsmA protein
VESDAQGSAVSFWKSRRAALAAAAVLIVALLLWRPGADRFRARLEKSLSAALAHKVEIGGVSFKLLPQPGFDLAGFKVLDDPQFGSEPILRAEEVSATIHPSSLWHWRIEIASLSFKEASLNLVRRADGTWNLEPILERAAQTPVAPTGSTNSGRRPRFPYIEVTDGRVNLKLGVEKTPFALTNADLALWLQSEDEWGVRLRAQPVRTDMRLTDTGLLQVDGSWRRAVDLRKTPLNLNARYDGAQLGQFSKLIYGSDKGLRGTLRSAVNLKGSVEDLQIQADASVDEFRRYDIVAGSSLRLAAQCAARYSGAIHELSDIRCSSSSGTGDAGLTGRFMFAQSPIYELSVTANQYPAATLVAMARRMKQGLPEDLSAAGLVDANLSFRKNAAGELSWSGDGEASGLALRSETLRTAEGSDTLSLGRVPFHAGPVSLAGHPQDERKRQSKSGKSGAHSLNDSPENAMEAGPVKVVLEGEQTADFSARFSKEGYIVSFVGEGPVQRLLQIGRLAGVTAIHPAIEGAAKFDWHAQGGWGGFAAPQTSGTMQLRNARVEFAGLNAPVEIAAVDLAISPEIVKLEKLAATTGGIHWSGTILRPRVCAGSAPCATTVDLHADEISTDQLNQLLNPNIRKRPWYRILTGGRQVESLFRKMNVQGSLKIDRFAARDFSVGGVAARISLDGGILQAKNLKASLFGGHHLGEWKADFTQSVPAYSGSGTCEGISLAQVGKAIRATWFTGAAGGKYEMSLSGWDASALQASAHGKLDLDARDGALTHFDPSAPGVPLRFRRLQTKISLGNSLLALSEGKLQGPSGIYSISGVASLRRRLDLTLRPESSAVAGRSVAVTGTVDAPQVERIADEDAARK